LLWPHRDRNFLPCLETHLEIFRDLVQIVPKLICGWWPIESGVIADRAKAGFTVVEILTIFPQTVPCERGLLILFEINLALPAFIGPGRGAESNQG
jgi:hypothetical protein